MNTPCKTFKCQRVGTCRLADDADAVITFDDDGERSPVCPLKYENCDKELKPYIVKKSSPLKLYGAVAAGVVLLIVILFAVTGEPSEEQRREAAAKELKEIWPWLQTR
jgi:hypothetical protein